MDSFHARPPGPTLSCDDRGNLGRWPEGLNAGATEFEVCYRFESRVGVAWPLDVRPHGSLFGHFGAVQARDDQR